MAHPLAGRGSSILSAFRSRTRCTASPYIHFNDGRLNLPACNCRKSTRVTFCCRFGTSECVGAMRKLEPSPTPRVYFMSCISLGRGKCLVFFASQQDGRRSTPPAHPSINLSCLAECCTANIEANGPLCSETDAAPCYMGERNVHFSVEYDAITPQRCIAESRLYHSAHAVFEDHMQSFIMSKVHSNASLHVSPHQQRRNILRLTRATVGAPAACG